MIVQFTVSSIQNTNEMGAETHAQRVSSKSDVVSTTSWEGASDYVYYPICAAIKASVGDKLLPIQHAVRPGDDELALRAFSTFTSREIFCPISSKIFQKVPS